MATLTTPPTSPTSTPSINSPTTTSTGPDTTDAIFPTKPIEEVLYNPASKDKAIMVTLMNLIIDEKLPFIRLATPNATLEVKREKKDGKKKWRIRQVAGPSGAIELCLDAGKRNDFDNQSDPIILRVKEIYLKACDNNNTYNVKLQKYLFREFKRIREENINSVIGGAIGGAMDFGYDDGEMTLVEQIQFYAEHINSLIAKADENQLNELARTKAVEELVEKMEKMKTPGGEKKTDPYQLRF